MVNKYIVWLSNKTEEAYGGVRYGWKENLTFTFDEAHKIKETLEESFDKIDVLKV